MSLDLPAAEPMEQPGETQSGMIRDNPDTPNSTQALITKWVGKIREAKIYFVDDFKRMDDDIAFLSGKQWPVLAGNSIDPNMVVNITQRHIQQRVAALYAKNPKVVCRRRQTLDYQHWDGTMAQLNAIQQQIASIVQQNQQADLQKQAIAQGVEQPTDQPLQQQPIPPEILATLEDLKQGTQNRLMLDKIAKTMEIIFNYILLQQIPPFKSSMKQLVRRTCATGLGWLKVGYQRNLDMRPEDVTRISGITEQMAHLRTLMSDAADGDISETQAEYAELENQLRAAQDPSNKVIREGLIYDFPLSKSLIVDPSTRHLCTLGGTRWVAEEFNLSNSEVKDIYGVDLASCGASSSVPASDLPKVASAPADPGVKKGCHCIWEVWDKVSGEVFTIAEGYHGYLRGPAAPDIRINRFFPYFGLAFNELEPSPPGDTRSDRISIYPISDVSLLRPMQKEYNRAREGLKRHRRANAPKIATTAKLSESDLDLIQNADTLSTTVIALDAVTPGTDIKTVLQPVQMPPIDPQLYDTSMFFEDILRTVGQSDASIGNANAGTTATGDSIAEQSRTISLASQVDDLDDMLTAVSRASGEILLAEMPAESAREIAGPGAVWPELSAQQISDQLYLEFEAGSSGRPNKAAEIANFQKIAPLLLQIPGISPEWMAKQAIMRLDDRIDTTDAIISGLPSILTQAQIKLQEATTPAPQPAGPEANPPSQQGAEGRNNATQPPGISGTQGGNEQALGGMA